VRLTGGAVGLAVLLLFGFVSPTHAPAAPLPAALPTVVSSVYVRLPQTGVPGQPLRMLVALHGIGGRGDTFASDLAAAADRSGWVLVAPTILYGDWMDPVQVAHEDAMLINWLSGYLAQLPAKTNQPLDSAVLLLGFSRGAQLAHRFAEAYPEHTLAVAAASAGSYTLPQTATPDGAPLLFPFGVADFPATVGQTFAPSQLRSVHFWVGVGNNDTNPADVPRQFDACQGDDRLDRARAFVAALGALNVTTELAVFPDVPHALTPAMVDSAVAFLAGQPAPSA